MAYTDLAKRDAYQRAYYLAHKAEKIAAAQAWRAANLDRAREIGRGVAQRRRKNQPEAIRTAQARYYATHTDAKAIDNRKTRLKRYGLTASSYDAMLAAQGGVCGLCAKAETHRSRNGEITRLAVDHDHATGSIRALLCHSCNVGIGSFYDDPELLVAAAEYVKRWRL